MKKIKRDIKKQPFCWQEKHILRLLQKTFRGTELSRYLLLYQTLTYLHSDFNGEPIKYFTKTISTYSGLSMRFIPEGIKVLHNFNIVKIKGLKEEGHFVTKVLIFTPENVDQKNLKFDGELPNNCSDSTIVEKAGLIEHSIREDKVSKDTLPPSSKNGKKPKRKVSPSVRMDTAPVIEATQFLTSSSQESQIFDKVNSLAAEANTQCTRSPAFSFPHSPDTKYLKVLVKQIKLLQAGKFVSAHSWMPFFNSAKFPGEELEGASDTDVWDMIEFSVMKYIRVRNSDKYLFYGRRDARITLADFMYISYQALRPPKPGVRTPDGYSRFWQYLLPLKKSANSTFEFDDQIKELYKKSSAVLGKEIYNNYDTFDTSEKIRFCKSLVAIGKYYQTNREMLLKNNAEAVLVIPNLKKVFKFYAKWIRRSGFEHVPGVYPGNEGRWTDFVNFLKKNYGVDLEAIQKLKSKKKVKVHVESEMSEDEAYERSILGVLYDVLDPDERLHKLKLFFRNQRKEKMESI